MSQPGSYTNCVENGTGRLQHMWYLWRFCTHTLFTYSLAADKQTNEDATLLSSTWTVYRTARAPICSARPFAARQTACLCIHRVEFEHKTSNSVFLRTSQQRSIYRVTTTKPWNTATACDVSARGRSRFHVVISSHLTLELVSRDTAHRFYEGVLCFKMPSGSTVHK
jgi:hypothetical protein